MSHRPPLFGAHQNKSKGVISSWADSSLMIADDPSARKGEYARGITSERLPAKVAIALGRGQYRER